MIFRYVSQLSLVGTGLRTRVPGSNPNMNNTWEVAGCLRSPAKVLLRNVPSPQMLIFGPGNSLRHTLPSPTFRP